MIEQKTQNRMIRKARAPPIRQEFFNLNIWCFFKKGTKNFKINIKLGD